MLKPSAVFVFFSLALGLAACGGGGSGSGGGILPSGGGSTPVPVTTPTPTPTPTPSGGATPAAIAGTGSPLPAHSMYNNVAWAPYDVASNFDFPVQHGWNGAGETVAIVIDSDVSRNYVSQYLAKFGITETGIITTIPINNASGIATNGDQTEAYLDVETVAALAPGANIRIYQTPTLNDSDIAAAYSKIDSDGVATVVNSSFGGCETPGSTPPEDSFIQTGAQAGIAYVASAGDNGNVCNSASPWQVGANWPASNPNVIGAGGTESSVSGGNPITNPIVWNDNSCTGTVKQCAGGGGVSQMYTIPSYQVGVAGEFSSAYRNVPDISMPAEDDAIDDGSWGTVNGTSWSAPQMAALMAEVYQYCHVTAGIASPATIPYYVDSAYPKAYMDVTGGTDEFQTQTPFYSAGPGYDNASGFGVPYGMAFANTVCPGGVKAPGVLSRSAMLSAASAQPIAANQPLDVTPRAPGLALLGERSANAPTNALFVLRSESDRSAVEAALQQAGFTVNRAYAYERLVQAQAPSATVGQFFRTRMLDVEQQGYGPRYMPGTQVVIPQSVAPYVVTVNLDNVVTRHVLTKRVTPIL